MDDFIGIVRSPLDMRHNWKRGWSKWWQSQTPIYEFIMRDMRTPNYPNIAPRRRGARFRVLMGSRAKLYLPQSALVNLWERVIPNEYVFQLQ